MPPVSKRRASPVPPAAPLRADGSGTEESPAGTDQPGNRTADASHYWRRRLRRRSASLPAWLSALLLRLRLGQPVALVLDVDRDLGQRLGVLAAMMRTEKQFSALASSTRTYAWAPHRSQTSSAVSGLVGAMAPVNVAFLRVVPPARNIRLAPVFCPYSSAQHIPRRQRSLLRVVYATSETALDVQRGHNCSPLTHGACVPPVLGGRPAAHRHRVSLTGHVPRCRRMMHSSWSVGDFRRPAAWHADGSPLGNATIFG